MKKVILLSLALAAVVLVGAVRADAANTTWTWKDVGADWGTGANWTQNSSLVQGPQTGGWVIMPVDASIGFQPTISFGSDTQIITQMNFLGTGYNITGTNKLRLAGVSSAGVIFTDSTTADVTNTIATGVVMRTATGNNIITVNRAGSQLTLSGAVSGNVGTTALQKNGSGTLVLTGANTYTGDTIISAGTISADQIVVASSNSSLGNATTAVTLGSASAKGYLEYTGAAAAYTRGFTTITGGGGGEFDNNGTGTVTISGPITGAGTFTVGGDHNVTIAASTTFSAAALTKTGSATLTLNAAYTTAAGAVSITGGTLAYGLTNAIAGGPVTINGGTMDLNAYTDSVGAFTLTSGTLAMTANQTATAQLTSTGVVALGASNTLDVTGMGTTAGLYKLINGTSRTGTFGAVSGLNSAYNLLYTTTGVDAQHKASQTLTSASPATINIYSGATGLVSATLTNTAPSASAGLGVTLADNSSTHGTLGSFTGTGPVVVGTPLTVGATFTAGAAGTGVWSLKNTDANAVTTSVNAGGTVNVYDHAEAVFNNEAANHDLVIDFGDVQKDAPTATQAFDIYNYLSSSAKLNLASIEVIDDTPPAEAALSSDIATFANLAGGGHNSYMASLLTDTLGSFQKTYKLHFSEEGLTGQQSVSDLTVTLKGVVIPEPATLGLLAFGGIATLLRRRTRA